jgi:hypothetical protein
MSDNGAPESSNYAYIVENAISKGTSHDQVLNDVQPDTAGEPKPLLPESNSVKHEARGYFMAISS